MRTRTGDGEGEGFRCSIFQMSMPSLLYSARFRFPASSHSSSLFFFFCFFFFCFNCVFVFRSWFRKMHLHIYRERVDRCSAVFETWTLEFFGWSLVLWLQLDSKFQVIVRKLKKVFTISDAYLSNKTLLTVQLLFFYSLISNNFATLIMELHHFSIKIHFYLFSINQQYLFI